MIASLQLINLRRRPHRHIATSPRRHQGFTLVEMVVVLAIIILLTGLVVPAATQMWRDRKIADAQNMITGMLMTARARAIQSGGAETGLFFFVDDQGVQRVAPITQNPNDPAQADQARIINGWQSDNRWYNVFTVIRDRSFTLPAPMRVVPLYAICPDSGGVGMCSVGQEPHKRFTPEELRANDFSAFAPGTTNVAQAHRNFFSLTFSPSGEMIVGRNVIIRDVDDEAEAEPEPDGHGVVTGARVVGPDVTQYYTNVASPSAADLATPGATLTASVAPAWLVSDAANVAMNFPSVDGLLVYDDSLFNEAGDAEPEAKRNYLKEYGLPFYINRITGAVVRGPSGEVQ